MKNRVILIALFFLSNIYLLGQSRPFPQNVDYPYGYQTTVISTNDIQDMYDKWKTNFLEVCSGMYRVSTDNADETRSEGLNCTPVARRSMKNSIRPRGIGSCTLMVR